MGWKIHFIKKEALTKGRASGLLSSLVPLKTGVLNLLLD
jgi:hypothetical protein